jgi:hypothetical protein
VQVFLAPAGSTLKCPASLPCVSKQGSPMCSHRCWSRVKVVGLGDVPKSNGVGTMLRPVGGGGLLGAGAYELPHQGQAARADDHKEEREPDRAPI